MDVISILRACVPVICRDERSASEKWPVLVTAHGNESINKCFGPQMNSPNVIRKKGRHGPKNKIAAVTKLAFSCNPHESPRKNEQTEIV